MRETKKSVTLYDGGGGFLIWVLFGIPLGSLFDYAWNCFVLSQTLKFGLKIHTFDEKDFIKDRRTTYGVFITLLGVVIDWAYIELIWDVDLLGKSSIWWAEMGLPFQLLLIIVPIAMLFAANFALAWGYLKLDRRRSSVIGLSMAVFTAPWLLVIYPHIAGWAV